MQTRILIVFLFILGLWGLLLARGAYLQILPNEKLQKLKDKQFHTKVRIPSRRGAIVDRNQNELAISITAYSLFADPKIIKDPKKTARKLSRLLKVPYKRIYKKIKPSKRRFVWLKRRLDRETKEKIRSWEERGLGFIEEARRVYPNGGLLSSVLGFVSSDGRGLGGIERTYNSLLSGETQEVIVRKDARGRPLLVGLNSFTERKDGEDLTLTIDRDLQFQLEKELKRTTQEHEAETAVGVVLDAKTSEVLAMANYPSFDSNRPFKYSFEQRRNKAITDTFEPGSTMKTILMAAALKEKVITPGKKYFCEDGDFRIGRRKINEADSRHHFGWLTATEVLAHSSNIGTSKIALELGAENYRSSLVEFGFGQRTGVDFPGEALGIVNSLPWRDHLLANVSFGHGVATTPLQMAAAYAAIASGGVWKSPRFTKEKNENYREKRILSQREASQIVLMLNAVTGTAGTVVNAKIPGFPVAGKTGTAQKVKKDGRGYVRGQYISSFAGFVPSHDPKYVIYVAVDNPKKLYYGSQVAAPVFSKIASYAIRREGLTPILISEENLLKPAANKVKQDRAVLRLKSVKELKRTVSLVPNLQGLTLREVFRQSKKMKFQIKFSGSGRVAKTLPPKGFPLPKDKEIEVFLER